MYRSAQDRKAWLFRKVLIRLQGIKDFIKHISTQNGFVIVETLSGELRFKAPFSKEDINDLKKELGIEA